MINKYISKKEISQMILVSTELTKLYKNLPESVKKVLGYTDINFHNSTSEYSPFGAFDFRNAYIENAL